MSEITEITTGETLGRFFKDQIASGVPADIAGRTVLLAAEALVRDGGLVISRVVTA